MTCPLVLLIDTVKAAWGALTEMRAALRLLSDGPFGG